MALLSWSELGVAAWNARVAVLGAGVAHTTRRLVLAVVPDLRHRRLAAKYARARPLFNSAIRTTLTTATSNEGPIAATT
jgi:hypothetical protein